MATFKAFVLKDLTDSVIVHDRYHLYDSAEIGTLTHQLCCQLAAVKMGDSPDIPVLSPGHLDEREPVAHNLVRCREIACVEASLNGVVGSAVVAVGLVPRRQDEHR